MVSAILVCLAAAVDSTAAPPSSPLQVTIRNGSVPGAFIVESSGPDVELSWMVGVERFVDGKWVVEPVRITLQETCAQTMGACLKLARGSHVQPKPWTGLSCASQCRANCRGNVWAGPGQFRFSVRSCDGKWRVHGPPFLLPEQDLGHQR
jgi:hypothetical protein